MSKRKIPDKCTLCGGDFTKNDKGGRVIFPYPMKHYLCFPCFEKSLNAGLARLNYVLAGGNLEDLKTEDAKDG